MPSVKVLEANKQKVAAISERLQGACAGVLVDYKGINVTDDTALRKELREAGVEYTVSKNTMITLAVKGTSYEGLTSCLEGTTALATCKADYVAAARILCKFASTHNNFTVKSGFLDDEVIGVEKVESLAKLPSREQLLATVACAFNAPIASLARALQAIVDKDGSAVAEAAAE